MMKQRLAAELLINRVSEQAEVISLTKRFDIELRGVTEVEGWSHWSSSTMRVPHLEVNAADSIQFVKKIAQKHLYLFANGSESDLSKIKPGHGFRARDLQFDFHVICHCEGDASVTVGCISYDEFGAKVKVAQGDSQHFVFSPGDDCDTFLPFIKVSGAGQVEIERLKISAAEKIITSTELSTISSDAMVSVPLKQLLKLEDSNRRRYDVRRREYEVAKREMELDEYSASTFYDENVERAVMASNALSLDFITELSKSISVSNGSKLHKPHDYSVGIVTDTYMFNYYKDAFRNVVALTPDEYESQFAEHAFDIVIYVTCWKGTKGTEWQGIHYREKPKAALDGIIKLCREQGVKLVFQSIEDPSNFEHFLPIAREFDYIFTSDSDMVPRYKEACAHEQVFYGEYGVNPLFNNPIDSRKYNFNAPFFAGSYTTRYEERCFDMKVMFDSFISSGVAPFICDRNLYLDQDAYKFPENTRPFIRGPLPHDVLQKVHKLFRYNVNFNSIKSSPTMCAMRIYELQAQCTSIMSNYAKSVFNKFPAIRMVPEHQDMQHDFAKNWLVDEYRCSVDATREMLSQKSAPMITASMLEHMGLKPAKAEASVLVIYLDDEVEKKFANQSWRSFVAMSAKGINDWAAVIDEQQVDFFICVSDQNTYGDYFLEDLINGFGFTSSAYITKPLIRDNYTDEDVYALGHRFVQCIESIEATLFDAREVDLRWALDRLNESDIELANGYQIDPFNFNEPELTSAAEELKFTVVVPTYNNGEFLLTKCIPSLKRNKMWRNIEVLLVDDGSTDGSTQECVKALAERYKNVKAYCYDDGGSGSASRPRNKGVELATTDYIGYLDPDNEISPNGYDQLYDLITHASEDLDFVSGYHMKVTKTTGAIGKHANEKLKIVVNPKAKFFESGKFPIIPTQPALISRRFLLEHNIQFVLGAVGQDTLYGWEILFNSKSCGFTNAVHLIYYAERETSVTNEYSNSFFDKSLVLERAQVRFLKQSGLFRNYVQNHSEKFFEGWYLPKVSKAVDKDHANKCLREIADCYGL